MYSGDIDCDISEQPSYSVHNAEIVSITNNGGLNM